MTRTYELRTLAEKVHSATCVKIGIVEVCGYFSERDIENLHGELYDIYAGLINTNFNSQKYRECLKELVRFSKRVDSCIANGFEARPDAKEFLKDRIKFEEDIKREILALRN